MAVWSNLCFFQGTTPPVRLALQAVPCPATDSRTALTFYTLQDLHLKAYISRRGNDELVDTYRYSQTPPTRSPKAVLELTNHYNSLNGVLSRLCYDSRSVFVCLGHLGFPSIFVYIYFLYSRSFFACFVYFLI